MKRSPSVLAAGVLAVFALAPASASASIIELGATSPSKLITPVCPPGVKPSACTIVLTNTTALETVRDRVVYPTKVTKAGRIVAWTIGLAQLSTDRATARQDIHILNSSYGGTTQAQIVVLKPGANRRWTVAAFSPVVHMQPFLGMVVQFPLEVSLPVVPGEAIGLSVPTWAPVLSYNLSVNKFAYRQSRMANCSNPAASQTVQNTLGSSTRYLCDYPGTRVEYSATEITTPVPPKNAIH